MFDALGHPLLHRLRYRRGAAMAFYDKPYAPTVPGKCVRGSLHQGFEYVRGQGYGQRAYPGDRQCAGKGERFYGYLGTEGTGGRAARTPAEGAGP